MTQERDHQFHCPSCGEEGVITLPDEFTHFGCPAECGASFVKYQGDVGWAIRCVVQPVYKRRSAEHPNGSRGDVA